ncbi:uncharacterized protein LOC114259772 isoform X1 [Camellia sinensis]|uniref:uncharacterized protein LOC114259772 isoform X1 n=1 Tax=Camellia sinensis TaxID=4442 RepID=UPI0010356B1A|nr:uncharacterized protein LOC114259772 isoform X1 [Camellia sinensis]
MEEAIRSLKENGEKQAQDIRDIKKSMNDINEIKEMITAMSIKYDQVASRVYESHQEIEETSQVWVQNPESFNQFQTRYTRIDFPKFCGKDPLGWIYKCKRFFDYNAIENGNGVKLASLHLENKALQWFQWFEKCHNQINWNTFKEGVVSRFGPNSYEDEMGDLTKLRQVTSVRAYQICQKPSSLVASLVAEGMISRLGY